MMYSVVIVPAKNKFQGVSHLDSKRICAAFAVWNAKRTGRIMSESWCAFVKRRGCLAAALLSHS
jgi:hypothetical protein